MKKLSYLLFVMILVPSLFLSSCKEDDTVEPVAVVLTDYMTANDYDLGSILKYHQGDTDVKFVVAAPATEAEVTTFLEKYYIIDIRSADVFAAGHLSGANNVEFENILTEADKAGDKPILMVCYTGQTACYGTSLLRLYGFRNTQALKWGMTGWNSTLDKWTPNLGNIAEGHTNWTSDAAPTNVKYDAPPLSGGTDGLSVLKDRVRVVVAEGFKGVSASDVLESPSSYFINNYFSEADYTGFGHIKGAYRINPLTIADDLILNINPDQTVVTYCYTGQTSAVISAYLRVLGYDAYSLKFGMNGLYNSNSAFVSNQWGVDSNSKNYPIVE